MSIADVVILAVVVVLCVLAFRSFLRSEKDGCSDCGSASTCSAAHGQGTCKVADDMVARADAALKARADAE